MTGSFDRLAGVQRDPNAERAGGRPSLMLKRALQIARGGHRVARASKHRESAIALAVQRHDPSGMPRGALVDERVASASCSQSATLLSMSVSTNVRSTLLVVGALSREALTSRPIRQTWRRLDQPGVA